MSSNSNTSGSDNEMEEQVLALRGEWRTTLFSGSPLDNTKADALVERLRQIVKPCRSADSLVTRYIVTRWFENLGDTDPLNELFSGVLDDLGGTTALVRALLQDWQPRLDSSKTLPSDTAGELLKALMLTVSKHPPVVNLVVGDWVLTGAPGRVDVDCDFLLGKFDEVIEAL